METLLKKYGYSPDMDAIGNSIARIKDGLQESLVPEVLMRCFSAMDLTTLKTDDTKESVRSLVEKVNILSSSYPEFPLPASVCVYPNFAGVVREARKSSDVHVTVVSGCFPSSQSFIEVKVRECELAVESGAEEIDIVLALDSFLSGDYEGAASEIRAMREAIDRAASKSGREVHLKVILETGLLVKPELIAEASFLAMEAGADFIKTSTGKVSVNATPEAAYVMCECISKYCAATGRKVGFKPAGGISSAEDAVLYYSIVKEVLGEGWLDKNFFRLGVSRVANSIMSAVRGTEVRFF